MSKVMNQLFLGSKTEEEIALSSDHEYIEWTEELDEQFRKEFEGFGAAEKTVPF